MGSSVTKEYISLAANQLTDNRIQYVSVKSEQTSCNSFCKHDFVDVGTL